MGVVRQERFLLAARNAGFRGVGFTCGGFIHQTARDEIDYYPAWINRWNLRFLYRMYREPHTRMRYLKAGIVFPIKFLLERLNG
jgi:N-acetylglucosaminyldiphosphoundecaprenol N-acetyl-beta-D-mannosaminyltransferase